MKVINKSRKIIAIAGEPLLPGNDMDLPEGFENHPSIEDYMSKKILVDAESADASVAGAYEISDAEKNAIAQAAVEKYKAEQAELAAKEAEKAAEIKAVKAMKKDELLTKAAGMGIELKDDDTAEDVRVKILDVLNK